MGVAEVSRALVAGLGAGPMFVHSDAFRVAILVPPTRDRNAYLDLHINLLRRIADNRSLLIPSFNYDFPRTRLFDVGADPAQLGPIPERYRTTAAEWRTPVPIFSVSGDGPMPSVDWGDKTDPFGMESIFAWLVEHDAVIFFYGDTFHCNTIVHHAERLAGGPPYRYDKVFSGSVRMPAGNIETGSLNYHVRPLDKGLDYDWPRLLDEAIAAGVCRRLELHPQILAASARDLVGLWVDDMRANPLSLLDQSTLAWVEPTLAKLGRRFEIGDFETMDTNPVEAE